MTIRRLFVFILVSVILLTACSNNSGSNKGNDDIAVNETTKQEVQQEITIWAWDSAFNIAAMEVAKEVYVAKNPDIKVKIVEYSQKDTIEKLNAGLNSGTVKGLPNILLIEDYRAKEFLQSYPDSFYPMTDNINVADFVEYKAAPTSQSGKQYGVPFDTGVAGLFIRTDYLEQAGYKLADVQDITWFELIEIGKRIKEVTGKHLLTIDPTDLGIIRIIVQSAGAWYTKEDGVTPYLMDNLALKEAFEVYKGFIDANISKSFADWSELVSSVNNGDVAAVTLGNWFIPSIKAEQSQAGKWAVVPIPKLSKVAGAGHNSNIGGSSWYVLNGDGKEAAADFLAQTFGSDVAMYEQLVSEIGAIGTLEKAFETEAYKQADPFFGGQKLVSDFAQWTKLIPDVNYGMHTYDIEEILVVEMQNYLNDKDLDKVLADAQKIAETQLR